MKIFITILNIIFLIVFTIFSAYAAENTQLLEKEVMSRSFPQYISHIAWSSDQSKIAVRGQGEVYLWDIINDEMVWKVWGGGPAMTMKGLAFSPDDNFVITTAAGSGNPKKPETFAQQNSLTLISVKDSNDIKYFSDHGFWDGFPTTPSFDMAKDGSVIAAVLGRQSGWLSLYEPLTGKVIGHVGQIINKNGNTVNPRKIVLDSDRHIVCTGSLDEIQTWDYKKNKKITSFLASKTGIKSLAFNPVSGELITGGDGVIIGAIMQGDGKLGPGGIQDEAGTFLRAWNPLTGKLLRNYRGIQYGVSSISVSPDGNYIAAIEGGPLPGVWLRLFDAKEGGLLKTIDYGREHGLPHAVSFSPDGHRLAVGMGKKVHVYELN